LNPAMLWGREHSMSAMGYRRKAEECRQKAFEAACAEDKAQWLLLADNWRALAESVERSNARPLPGLVKT
jgi:hypothetical protein